MYGHVECTINAIFKDFTFFFHTCIMCLYKLGFFPCTIQLFIVWSLEDLPQVSAVAIYLVNLFG